MLNEEFFCGLAVVSMGDLIQLPPVGPAETLHSAVLTLLNEKVSLHPQKTLQILATAALIFLKLSQKSNLLNKCVQLMIPTM
jgi:hypothetical protein